jgi:hypothetical protein
MYLLKLKDILYCQHSSDLGPVKNVTDPDSEPAMAGDPVSTPARSRYLLRLGDNWRASEIE